jgi:hypothetical protein
MGPQTVVTWRGALPEWARASFRTDLAQLQCGVRPVIRSEVRSGADRQGVRGWARRNGFFAAMDEDGFFALSRSSSAAALALRIDRRPGSHVIALGRALGYPPCCCRAASKRREEHLDGWSAAIARRRFIGSFSSIRPDRYAEGESLISHVPCSQHCGPSRRMAMILLSKPPREGGFAISRGQGALRSRRRS